MYVGAKPDSCERQDLGPGRRLPHPFSQMGGACTLRQVVAWALVATAIAVCSSCGRRPGETSSARSAGREEATPSAGSASRLANEPQANTFEHPALQEQLVHEKWHGDLDGIVTRRILPLLVPPTTLRFSFHSSETPGPLNDF